MEDENKTKKQLVNELLELRQRIAELEKSEKQYKLIEQAVNESEQKFRNIVEHSNELFYVHDIHHKLTYVSPQSLQILGYTPDEMMTQWTNLVTENPINKLGVEITEKALKTGKPQKPYLLELYRKNGSKVLLEIDESPLKDKDGNVIGIVGAARDITERKQKEEAIRDSETRYRALFDRTLFCVYVHDFEGRFMEANEAALKLLGYTKEEITSLDFSSLLEKEHLPAAFKIMEEIKQSGFQKKPAEWKLRKKNGEYVWVETEASIIYRPGKPYALQGIARDITDRKRAEKALRENEEKFRILAETNTAALVIFQGEKFCYVNPATEALTGYSKEELLKKNFGVFIHPEFRQLIKEREFIRQH